MTQLPRTPVHFPRMKVRGRQNKGRLAARHTTEHVVPYARAVRGAHEYTFIPIPEMEPGAVSIRTSVTVDGFGRRVYGVESVNPTPRPTPKPEASFSTSFEISGSDYGRLHRLIFGGGEDDSVVQG